MPSLYHGFLPAATRKPPTGSPLSSPQQAGGYPAGGNNENNILLPMEPDAKSPAGADIRFIMDGETGNMIHCTVPPHQINRAVVHATVLVGRRAARLSLGPVFLSAAGHHRGRLALAAGKTARGRGAGRLASRYAARGGPPRGGGGPPDNRG